MIALSIAISFLGCLAFAAFVLYLRAHRPESLRETVEVVAKDYDARVKALKDITIAWEARVSASETKVRELEQRLDARELAQAMKGTVR